MRGTAASHVAGLVLEVRGRRAVVLSAGRFLRLRAIPGWEPGQEVWLAPAPSARARWRVGFVSVAAAAGAAVAVLAGGAVAAAVPMAVVSVDVNPSVQLVVNDWARVLRVLPMDADGRLLVADTGPLDHLPVAAAVADLVTGAVRLGYVDGAASVPVAVVAAGSRPAAVTGSAAPAATAHRAPASASAGETGTAASGTAGTSKAQAPAAPASSVKETGSVGTGTPAAGNAATVGSGAPRPLPATVLIAFAPLRGRRDWIGPAVNRGVASAAADVRALLDRRGAGPTLVAVDRGRAEDVRAARADMVSLGEYMLARDLAARGVSIEPQAFRGQALDEVLARAGVRRGTLAQVLQSAASGERMPPPAAALLHGPRLPGATAPGTVGPAAASPRPASSADVGADGSTAPGARPARQEAGHGAHAPARRPPEHRIVVKQAPGHARASEGATAAAHAATHAHGVSAGPPRSGHRPPRGHARGKETGSLRAVGPAPAAGAAGRPHRTSEPHALPTSGVPTGARPKAQVGGVPAPDGGAQHATPASPARSAPTVAAHGAGSPVAVGSAGGASTGAGPGHPKGGRTETTGGGGTAARKPRAAKTGAATSPRVRPPVRSPSAHAKVASGASAAGAGSAAKGARTAGPWGRIRLPAWLQPLTGTLLRHAHSATAASASRAATASSGAGSTTAPTRPPARRGRSAA